MCEIKIKIVYIKKHAYKDREETTHVKIFSPPFKDICLSGQLAPPIFSSNLTISLKSPMHNHGKLICKQRCLNSAQECSRLAVTGFP